eukprot:TRINITY_DN113_c0_g1_i11.p2 TRINITY_DN113_c0_g1~~TRINITY_DN113_c0_g1_i11.p2  ORF type:complete len:102 (-),score=9.00 TRINITY_DN113_c0_g1_i11:63-368(-)
MLPLHGEARKEIGGKKKRDEIKEVPVLEKKKERTVGDGDKRAPKLAFWNPLLVHLQIKNVFVRHSSKINIVSVVSSLPFASKRINTLNHIEFELKKKKKHI